MMARPWAWYVDIKGSSLHRTAGVSLPGPWLIDENSVLANSRNIVWRHVGCVKCTPDLHEGAPVVEIWNAISIDYIRHI